MKLIGTELIVESGGIVQADNLHVVADYLTVEDSAYIKADKLVSHVWLLIFSHFVTEFDEWMKGFFCLSMVMIILSSYAEFNAHIAKLKIKIIIW